MLLIDILKDDAFMDSQILAGQGALHKEVSSVMILEASDIENWGTKNQLILTSYYALADLDQQGLESFYIKLKDIGISGLIIKPKRLIDEVPHKLIDLSNKHQIPLISIDPKVKYEQLVLAVLQPIIHENANLLNAYYDYRRLLSEFSLKNYPLKEVLIQFKDILHSDTQLEILEVEVIASTINKAEQLKQIDIQELENIQFVAHEYVSRKMIHPNKTTQDILSVYVPNIDQKPYLFSIFKDPNTVSEKEYMLIENAVEYLQTHLLIDHSIKKDVFVHKNNQMLDLLFDTTLSQLDINRTLDLLNINQFDYYQGVIFSVKSKDPIPNHLMEKLVLTAKSVWPHVAFLQKNEDILFVYNLPSDKVLTQADFQNLLYEEGILHVAISEVFEKDFTKQMQTLEKMRHFMSVIYPQSTILEYSNLGFYKLFLNVESIDELIDYIPQSILNLIEEKPDLAQTLETFLDQSQNFVKTGEILYIHPKTVRYRIERISEILDLDFDNANQLLTIHVALKVCSYAKIQN